MSELASEPDNEAYNNEDGVLLVDAFPHFALLLIACQDYARLSECKFSSESFRGVLEGIVDLEIPGAEPGAQRRPETWLPLSVYGLVAECRAAPAVGSFAGRLLAGEPGLVEELHRSSHLVVSESMRRAMTAALAQCGVWPPPPGVDDRDCSYEDTSAPLLVIARRAYNDEVRRASEAALNGGISRVQQKVQTALFIVSFAQEIGAPMPAVPHTYSLMLVEFAARVAEWEEEHRRAAARNSRAVDVRAAFLRGLGTGAVADRLRAEFGQLWEDRRGIGFKTVADTIDWAARLNPISFVFLSGFVLSSFSQSMGAPPPSSKKQTTHATEALLEQPVTASVLAKRAPPAPEAAKAALATDELDLALVCASLT